MSKYSIEPMSFDGLRTVPLAARGGKVRAPDFAKPYESGSGVLGLLDAMPRILAADSLRHLAEAILVARQNGRAIIWGLGGHVIKCGLAPVLADLARRGFVTAFALNGAAAIHDFEIALAGHTSEEVESVLPDGSFGSAEETGRLMNQAVVAGVADGIGMGEAFGRSLEEHGQVEYQKHSLLWQAHRRAVPVTVHAAVGTDTIHMHPGVDAAALGKATHHDFRLFCTLVKDLDDRGCYINVGSAVLLPEVFLKAVSAVRNLGGKIENFTTANLDFLQHYRPRVNVVERPHAGAGGKGISLTGHHEILVPLLAALLIECSS